VEVVLPTTGEQFLARASLSTHREKRMKNHDILSLDLRAAVIALALTAAGPGAQAAPTYITNGGVNGVEAIIDEAGNFDDRSSFGLSYQGHDFINFGTKLSWYWFANDHGDSIADFGFNPLSATTSSDGTGLSATTVGLGEGWAFSQTATAVAPDKLTVTVSLTNHTGSTVGDARWGVGIDPDQDVPKVGSYETTNTIVGVGNDAAVRAFGERSGLSVTLANVAGTGPSLIAPYVDVGNCCSAVNPGVPFAAPEPAGFSHFGDDTVSLAYDFGSVADGQTVTFGYSYTFAAVPGVPEPANWMLLLAGLGVVGATARRRKA
jgi:hypothetical protein